MRIPFFHYTSLDNLPSILINARLVSRSDLNKRGAKFNDVSIDPTQPVREELGLLKYIPLFVGFYTYKNYELKGYLGKEYDYLMVQNKSFYGTLNKTLQTKMGSSYEKIVILLVNNELVYEFADQGKIRFFTDLAVKRESVREIPIRNRLDLENCLKAGIEGSNISGEIDLFDDGQVSIGCMSDIEAIIVDNDRIKTQVIDIISKYNTRGTTPLTLVTKLPRNPAADQALAADEQKAFAKYVEDLKQNGVTGEKYREKIAEWQREHKKI